MFPLQISTIDTYSIKAQKKNRNAGFSELFSHFYLIKFQNLLEARSIIKILCVLLILKYKTYYPAQFNYLHNLS